MKQSLIKLRHWWQRNFGHVYASPNGKDWYRFRARFGCIALAWVFKPFIVRLADDHRLIIADENWRGHGKPYGGWQWDYEPHGRIIGDGGVW